MPLKKLAVFSIMQNEDIFSRMWVNYYSTIVSKSDIYVLNHNTTTVKALAHLDDFKAEGVNVVNVTNPVSFDHEWLRTTVQTFQKKLLEEYEVVIFAESDEFIAANPTTTNIGLADYILNVFKDGTKATIRCMGFCVDHDPSEEPGLDLSRPVLDQRSKWRRTFMFDKPLISNQPCEWHRGFHWLKGKKTSHKIDTNVILLHLHKMDYEMCLKKHEESSKRNWSKKDIREHIGTHNLMCEKEAFDNWFFKGSHFQRYKNELVKFPESIKNIVIKY